MNTSNPDSSARELGLLLNTELSASVNVTRTTRKARGMFFLPTAILRHPDPLYKAFIRPHLEYAIHASSPILSRDCQVLESVQKLAVKFDAIRLI